MKPARLLGLRGSVAVGAALMASVPAPGAEARVTFRKHVITSGAAFGSATAADLNGDGRADVAVTSPDEVAWYDRHAGDGPWVKHRVQARTPATGGLDSIHLLTADVDRDGRQDLVLFSPTSGRLGWFENPEKSGEAQGWVWHLVDTLPSVHGLALEDLDGDGRAELVATYEGAIAWFRVPGNPRAAGPAGPGADSSAWRRRDLDPSGASGRPHYLSFGDVDGDGDRDLCTAAAEGNYLAWWERPADVERAWTKHIVREQWAGATHLEPADVDRDGKLDLLYCRGHAAGIGWLRGPDWKPEQAIDDGWLNHPHAMVVGDLNGDGAPDVAAAGREDRRLAWWENDGKGRFARREVDLEQSGLDIRATDVDGDRDLDLLVAGGTAKNVVWYESQKK